MARFLSSTRAADVNRHGYAAALTEEQALATYAQLHDELGRQVLGALAELPTAAHTCPTVPLVPKRERDRLR